MRTLFTKQPSNQDSAHQKPVRTAPIPVKRSFSKDLTGSSMLQRKPSCACGGGCPRCQDNLMLQTKVKISEPGDVYEQEADRVADEVMQMPEPTIQRKPLSIAITPVIQAKGVVEGEVDSVINEINATKGSGSSVDSSTKSFMESKIGSDFSNVRIHTDQYAVQMSQQLKAQAFTVGNDIYFNSGQYAPSNEHGRHLLAHELAHTIQQSGGIAIQRSCDDPDFCTPYATSKEASDAEWWIRNTYLHAEGIATFGDEVKQLYESFLSRKPGDSLAPKVFDNDSSYLVSSFKDSGDTADDQDAVIDLIGSRLSMAPGGLPKDYRPTSMSASNFLSPTEMNNRPINYSNPFSVAGHIAGGIGSSDAGSDYRKISYGNVTLEKVPIIGGTGYIKVETTLHYEVFDAIDFCPGDCGSGAEQIITIPMSRLEASGEAYDVPFKVIFIPESRSKRFFY